MCDGNCQNCIAEIIEKGGLKFGAIHGINQEIRKLGQQEANLGGSMGDTTETITETQTTPTTRELPAPHSIIDASGMRGFLPKNKRSKPI